MTKTGHDFRNVSNFLTNCQSICSQTTVISFEYVDLGQKIIAHEIITKFHNLTCIIQNYLYYCGFCTPSFSQIPQHNAGRAEMLPIQVIQEIMVNIKKEILM